MSDTYVLQVEWSEPDLPRLVGPFETRTEAEEWAMRRIVNGEWNVSPMAPPVDYAPPTVEGLEREDDEDDYDLRGEA